MNQGLLFTDLEDVSVVVFDFETTGMSPLQGDRVIEVGAVRLAAGKIIDQFQSLINPDQPLDPYITELTGIDDLMLAGAPSAQLVIHDFKRFIGHSPLVAHNASFDKRFLEAEFNRFSLPLPPQVGCSMLAARRIFPEAPNHKLGTLVSFLELPTARRFHRALGDASMTAHLWHRLEQELCTNFGFREVPFSLLDQLGQISCRTAPEFLRQAAQKQSEGG